MSTTSQSEILFGAGCFWGVQDIFDGLEGVITTEVGYSGGHKLNPTYQEVCAGNTGHAEVVRVVYDPKHITLEALLDVFWQCHNPSLIDRQGPDVGRQYRSCIYYDRDEDLTVIEESRQRLEESRKYFRIVTEIKANQPFFKAEEYHQHYHQKNNSSC